MTTLLFLSEPHRQPKPPRELPPADARRQLQYRFGMDARFSRSDFFIATRGKPTDVSTGVRPRQHPSTYNSHRRHEFLFGSVESGWILDNSGGRANWLPQPGPLPR